MRVPLFARLLLLAAVPWCWAQAPAESEQDGESALPADAADSAPGEEAEEEEEASPALSPRGEYNLGLARLRAGDATAAAEAFLTARDEAGPDPELRYRAAFNLGLALAAQADFSSANAAQPPADDAGENGQAPLEEVIDLLRQSAAWFNDAVRLAPAGDDDARVNLELISRRILQLADQLNEGDKLERRLDRLIDDQRGARDQARQLLGAVGEQGASAEPLGFKTDFEALASRERMLMAEVGDGIDLATEERLFIEQAPAGERTPEQQARAHRLAAVTDYLERARQSLSDARRRLRRLQGERAHRRADAALAELKRAREQLRDPVTVLNAVARDEGELILHTAALAAFGAGAGTLEEAPPAWLTAKHLRDRQEDAAARTGGVLGIFEAMLMAEAGAEAGAEEARVRAAVGEAAPVLERGLADMRAALRALEAGDARNALPAENAALLALRDAIELFADAKGLIELAYAGQRNVVALLTPPAESPSAPDAAATARGRGGTLGKSELDEAERSKLLGDLVFAGQRRLSRLGPLLAQDRDAATTAEQADEQAKQAAEQRYQLAEKLRADAEDGLARLAAALDKLTAGGDADAARANAEETLATLEQLRRLFFNIAEHLQALHAEQAQTHDQTATTQFESTVDKLDTLPAELGRLAERQARHTALGEQLAAALAGQADAAAATSADAGASGAAGAPNGEQIGQAADEVRQAAARMTSAATMLADAAAKAGAMSPELEPTLADQTAAMEHLENALRALAPPNQRPDGEQGKEQQGEQQAEGQEQDGQSEEERMSQRQALKRLQAIRDRETERQRRRQAADAGREPVEKDW